MKRYLFFITTLLIPMTFMIAQESSTFSIGPRVGINFSNLTNTNEAEFKPGLVAGLTSTYSINEKTGLTFDALYSQEGSQYNINATTVKTDLDYIRLLLAYNVFFGDLGDRLRPKLYIGPTLGFLIDANTKVRDLETDIMDNYKKLDVGLAVGLGFNYRIGGQQWLNFDARFQPGLTNIVENKPSGSDAIRNQTIQLSLGIAFGLD